jgi:hypothetical protein
MNAQVTVRLYEGDSFAYDAAGAAAQVIAALGGDPSSDYCSVDIIQPVEQGSAGSSPASAAASPA